MNITEEHYEYANNMVKIFGFNNLADYKSRVSYSKLKTNSENISKKLNDTMDKFKKLFPLKEFDLARINYYFETIEQLYSFFKKLLDYLFIPYYIFREKGSVYLRLIQQNNLYISYIQKMSDFGQIPIQCAENTIDYTESIDSVVTGQIQQKVFTTEYTSEQEKNYKLSEIIDKYAKKSFTQEYIINKKLDLLNFKIHFDCITEISIEKYEKIHYDSNTSCTVELIFGIFKEYNKTLLLNDIYSIKDITIPIFSLTYNCKLICEITNQEKIPLKVNITGFKFKSNIPQIYYLKNLLIDTIHDDNYEYIIINGSIHKNNKNIETIKIDNNTDEDRYIDPFEGSEYYNNQLKKYRDTNKISEYNLVVDNNNIWITSINNDIIITHNNVNEVHCYVMIYMIIINRYKKYGYSILSKEVIERKHFGIETNIYGSYNFVLSELKNNSIVMIYNLESCGDLLKNILVLNKFTSVYNIKISLSYRDKIYYTNEFKNNEEINIKFTNPISLLLKKVIQSYAYRILVEIPKDKFNDWEVLNLSMSQIYLSNDMRAIVAQNSRIH